MTIALATIAILAVLSFSAGLYFRVAEYDVLAADRVWERIAPAAQQLVDDETVPDEVAAAAATFTMLSGCGCFVRVMLVDGLRHRLGVSRPLTSRSVAFEDQLASLDDEARHVLANLMRDIVIFDSLHAPVIGRICRVVHRRHFARETYRVGEAIDAEREAKTIVRIARSADMLITKNVGGVERMSNALAAA